MKNSDVKIYFHIGMPKTGTSSIQSFLNTNRELLVEKYGILYPNLNRNNFGKGFCLSHGDYFSKVRETEDISGCVDYFKECKSYCINEGINKIIISHEGFFSNWWPANIQKIISENNFDYKIILYLRRQDYWAESAWKQWGHKIANLNSINDYINSLNLNWHWALSDWLKMFDPDVFIVRPFERESLVSEDVITDFLNLIGIKDKTGFLNPPVNNINNNRGVQPVIIEMMKLCNTNGLHDHKLLDNIYDMLPNEYKRNNPFISYGILSPQERIEILKKYEDSNQKLAVLFFNDKRENIFLEPYPDQEEKWLPRINELKLEHIVPVFLEIMIKQNDLIKKVENNYKLLKANIMKTKYHFMPINLSIFHGLIKKINNLIITEATKTEITFTAMNDDPSFIIGNSNFFDLTQAIRISIFSPSKTDFQIFYLTKQSSEFREENSVSASLSMGRNTIILRLPSNSLMKLFRFDPGRNPGQYIIYSFEIGY